MDSQMTEQDRAEVLLKSLIRDWMPSAAHAKAYAHIATLRTPVPPSAPAEKGERTIPSDVEQRLASPTKFTDAEARAVIFSLARHNQLLMLDKERWRTVADAFYDCSRNTTFPAKHPIWKALKLYRAEQK